jgi:uncharacterized protein (DUF2235 family)
MKNIVICSDGTWNSPEKESQTNVLRLSRAISPRDTASNEQVVFYDWGVGSDRKTSTGGITGAGLDKNIQDCYRFLVQNYDPSDKLFFFGFSRGAYTVRSLAGLIRNCGILKKEHANQIPSAFEHYRKRQHKTGPDSDSSTTFRSHYAVADRTQIEFLGVWDTVGSLGIPTPFFGVLNKGDYLFHDTSPSSIIRCARHAMSIDENRIDFPVTRWEPKPGLDLKEVWFAGVHSDVGGGYKDNNQLSEIPAAWMIREASKLGLKVENYLQEQLVVNVDAPQHRQPTGIFKFRGKENRTILENDRVHHTVKSRFEKLGSSWSSPSFRSFFKKMKNDWEKVKIEF